jgi:hypothetical protein
MFSVIALAGAVASAAEPIDRLLELPFGKSLDRVLAKCPKEGATLDWCGETRSYPIGIKKVVMKLRPPTSNDGTRVPAWVPLFKEVRVVIADDGIIDEIHGEFDRLDLQDETINSISLRFGPPTKRAVEVRQNGYGAFYRTQEAEWRTPSAAARAGCMIPTLCYFSFYTDRVALKYEANRRNTRPAPRAP